MRYVHAATLRRAALSAVSILSLAFASFAGELSLSIKAVPDDFAESLPSGEDPELSSRPGLLAAIGVLNAPGFAVKSPKSIRILDAGGKPLEIVADKSTYYSEFDDGSINSLKIEFFIAENALSSGEPRLVWGEDVENPLVREADSIAPKAVSLGRYRFFSAVPVSGGKGGGDSKVASIQVLVDDYADSYFWWYLLPLLLLAGLVVLRRFKSK